MEEDPALATVAGLVLEGVDSASQDGMLVGAGGIGLIFKKIIIVLKKVLKAFKP